MKVIILSSNKYKEKDCIYNALSEQGSLSFKAKGAQDSKSQFAWLNNVLTVADVEFADGKYKYPILKNASLVSSSITGKDDLEYLFAISALAEITKEMFDENDRKVMFNDLLQAVDALKHGKDPRMVVLIFIAHCTKYAGMELEVDKCVFSGSTSDIVAFSFSEGGFVSREYVTEETAQDLTPQQMKLIRYCFKSPNYSCIDTEKYSKADKQVLLSKLKQFIDDMSGAVVRSLDYLIK